MSEIGWKEVLRQILSALVTGIMVLMGIGLVWVIIVILLLISGRTTWAIWVGAPLAIIVLLYLVGWIWGKIRGK